MSDENTNEQTPEETPAPVGADLPEVDEDSASGYSVYDHTLGRYVTGVHDKREASRIAKAGPEGHELEVRRV